MELFRYQRDDGSEPFSEWLAQLDDRRAQANVRVRLLRLEAGNLGDVSAVGEGVMELRIHVSAGYRVYAIMNKLKNVVSHREREIAELRADHALAVEYLRAAMESLDDPADRGAGLAALRVVAEAYGGLGLVASQAGISRESLYRALSPKGNPTLKTLIAILQTVGMRLSVEAAPPIPG
jgi:putative addiction module killer protein/probable addiction module antidote protein